VVFFNYTTMQVSAKIVYYGPGLCGKTTNLQQIHGRTDPGSRGEMVSLETEADRTLFFDLLPLEVGTIGGMRVRLQLYTVPGQVFYNTTRKLVLKGVDGIVFVADSQEPALDANIESFHNLRKNLEELNQPLGRIPFVFQYNKRDLRNILPVEALERHLNTQGFDSFEGAALHGVGVFETLKAISKKTLAAVHRKISGEEEIPVLVGARHTSLRQDAAVVEDASGGETPPLSTGAPPAEAPLPTIEDSEESSTDDKPIDEDETSGAVFAELEEDLDPDAVAITEGPRAAPPPPISKEATTAEVKIEFAANPDVTQDLDTSALRESAAKARSHSKVETHSRLDIERELLKLREMAFADRRGNREAPEKSKTDYLEATGKVAAPREALMKATGVLVDLKLVGAGPSHVIPGVVKLELRPHEPGALTRLRLEIELSEDEGD